MQQLMNVIKADTVVVGKTVKADVVVSETIPQKTMSLIVPSLPIF